MAKELQNIGAEMQWKSIVQKFRRFLRRTDEPQLIDREYIEDESPEEIGHISDTQFRDKAERPLPHIPSSHSPERRKGRAA